MSDWTGIESTADPRWETFRAEVERASGGRGLERLVASTADGLGIEPVYIRAHRERVEAVPLPWTATRGDARSISGSGWRLRVPVLTSDVAAANRALRQDLERGAEGALLVLAPRVRGADRAWPAGVDVDRRAQLELLLEGVHLEMIDVGFDAGIVALPAAHALIDLAERRGLESSALSGCLGVDWTTARVHLGAIPAERRALVEATVALVQAVGPTLRVGRVDGTSWAEAGASAEQVIAAMLADAVETWRAWAELGVDPRACLHATELRVSLSPDVLETIAFVRALRRTFDQVAREVGADRVPFIEGVPNRSMLTRWDAHTNLLRITSATAAGAMAGVDAMVAVPFDLALGTTTELSRRLARNVQHILREESHLGHVRDPGGGAYYVEARTEALARAAWARFQRFEAEGGLSTALETGRWQDEIRERREQRFARVARRQDAIVGVSIFPNAGETPPFAVSDPRGREASTGVVDGPSFAALRGTTPAEWAALATSEEPWIGSDAGHRVDAVPPIPRVRWADVFESLRDRAASLEATGKPRPRVFLANLGRRADFSARSTWTFNLLTAGGFQVTDSEGFEDPEAAVRALKDDGADIAFMCGSDDAYRELGAAFASALHAATPSGVYLAGALPPELEDAPLAGFITAKDDALAFLERSWARWEDKSR